MKNTLLAIALLVLSIAPARAFNDNALFWQLQSDSAKVYLLGSIHYADESFYPLRREIQQAFNSADHLVVEINIDDEKAQRYRELVRLKGSYQGEATVRDEISEETYRQLQNRLRRLGIPLDMVQKQKPGMLVLTLTAAQVMKMGFLPEMGIDAYFLKRAAESNKNIIELETVDDQMGIFLNITDGDLLLRETLHSMDEAEMQMMDMSYCWKEGDEACLEKILFEDAIARYPSFASIYDSLFFSRNENMANVIEGFLKGKGTYFVVIGAGHLVGDKGIPQLLRNAGFDVGRM
jgi:uncharacterized protein YbaP (TraB family)